MERLLLKRHKLERRMRRVKSALKSSDERKRLVLKKTNRYLLAQIIDDKTGTTLCQAATFEKNFDSTDKSHKNRAAAKKLGETIAARAKEKGITKVVFDRRGRLYHGKIADFADQARESGLEF